ncbi:hypothetical protein EGI31_07380 [Lacihabitans soyangensis]|uniref:Uncharacterized protein n=2 Tax=Lacihabitans soyangensis TaxID=869394 RepID=A0AAE3KSN4_9BACT|nr:hypothetical protein [Lacihabitans soyangensis]
MPASTIFPGEQVAVYKFKLLHNTGNLNFQNISFTTSGTYTSSDVQSFSLSITGTGFSTCFISSVTPATPSAGETITFTLPSPSSCYTIAPTVNSMEITLIANLKPGAVAGRTIFVNGAVDPAIVTFSTAGAISTNLQSNLTGVQTVGTRAITLSTEAAPSGILYAGLNNLVHVLKVTSNGGSQRISTMTIPFSGTLLPSDIESVELYENTTNSLATAVKVNFLNVGLTSGQITLSSSFIILSNIPNGTSKYYFIKLKVKPGTSVGKTFKINGLSGPLSLTMLNYTNTIPLVPTVTNSQTDLSDVHTVGSPTVTHTTESVPPINIYRSGAAVIYKMKIDPSSTTAVITALSVTTSGTYASGDITNFSLYSGDASTYSTALLGTSATSTGATEVVNFTGLSTVLSGSPTYLYIIANVKNTAIIGNTIKINGALNPVAVTYSMPSTVVTNSQSNLAGTMVISSSNVTYTALPVPAGNLPQGLSGMVAPHNIIYQAKISSANGPVKLSALTFTTSGTYVNGDFGQIHMRVSNSTSSSYFWSFTPTIYNDFRDYFFFTNGIKSTSNLSGNGELVSFTGLPTISGDVYITLTVEVKNAAVNGHTIKINAASNPTSIAFAEIPILTQVLGDVADFQTITANNVIISSLTTPANTTSYGSALQSVYTFKVESPIFPSTIRNIKVQTSGTATASDGEYLLYKNSVNDLNTATLITSNHTSGTSSNLNFQFYGASSYFYESISAGSSKYFFVVPVAKSSAINGRTFKVDGSANPIVLTFANADVLNIINNQTDIGGPITILMPTATVVSAPILSTSSTSSCIGNAPSGPTLTGSGCPAGSQTVWFLGGSTIAFASTNGSINVSPTIPSTYTVSCMGNGVSSPVSSSITIYPIIINQPTSLTASPTFSPSTGSPVVLTATGCGTQTVVWENLSTTNPRTVTPSVDKVYSFRCSNGPCTSTGEMSYALTIGPCLLTHTLGSPTDDVSTGVFTKIASANISGKVTATNKITGTAKSSYTARVIELQPGFLADTGTLFLANTGGCF